MKFISLPGGKSAKVSDRDYDFVSQFRWSLNSGGYAQRSIGLKKVSMHQFLMECPFGMFVDHIDGDRLNNTRDNLRVATRTQNQRNSGPRKGRTYKGTVRNGKGWLAKINFGRSPVHLGTYSTEEAAARAYDRKAHELDPEFAKLNFPTGIWSDEQLAPYRLNAAVSENGTGIQPNGGGWAARVKRGKKNHYVGTFKTKEEAMKARTQFISSMEASK